MNIGRFGSVIVMRLDPGEEVMSVLREFAACESIDGAMFQGIGAFAHVDLRYFDVTARSYKSHRLDQQVEVISLLGSIGSDRGTLVLHIHAAVADASTRTYSGHLKSGVVSPTLEIFITLLEGTLGRKKDSATGLELLNLEPAPARR